MRLSDIPKYDNPKNGLFGKRLEDCTTGGCMFELVIQLSMIMIGKQLFNSIVEIFYP